ncbi:hypothetical protein BCD67_20620 [Oscillatoriales cyanobacterium USR001]|nr:hypothetical protein BCD67_20620 [Oscillatoriales cyanobacterium USR001]
MNVIFAVMASFIPTSRKAFLLLSVIVIIFYICSLIAILRLNIENISNSKNHLLAAIKKIIKYRLPISLGLFILASYFIFFVNLGVPSVQMWDESRRAVNALEMSINGNLIITYFNGKPDLWGTKPPLLIWLIVLSMKIFGYNEFSLRLPSALSAITTAIIIFIFSTKYLKDLKIGLVSSLVLITSSGFIGHHAGRSGDYDAILVLWITIYSLSYFIYLHSDEPKKQNFYWSIATVAIILAVFTKGIAGILPLPGILLYTAYQKKMGKLLFSSRLYISLVIFTVLVLGYYFLREYYNPGYISAVLNNEVGGRYLEAKEDNNASFLFYLQNLITNKFIPWIYVLPVAWWFSILSAKKNLKNLGIFGIFYLTCYLLIISWAKTKLHWYDNPAYPIAALVIGIGISEIFQRINTYFSMGGLKRQLIFGLTVISIFFIPYFNMAYNLTYRPDLLNFDMNNPQIMYRDYFQEIFKEMPELKKFTGVSYKYNAHLIFYSKLANITQNYAISYLVNYDQKNKKYQFVPQEVVVTCEPEVKQVLTESYKVKLLHSQNFCSTFVIEE